MNDCIIDENQDLLFENGDFLIDEASEQHIQLLFAAAQGEFKEYPVVGINLPQALHGNIDRTLDRTIRVQLEADEFTLSELNITEDGVQVAGNY